MAQLTLIWPKGETHFEKVPAGSGKTIASQTLAETRVWIERPVVPVRVYDIAALYQHFVDKPPRQFVKDHGLLFSNSIGKRWAETLEDIQAARLEFNLLVAARNTKDWRTIKRWLENNPKAVQFSGVIGEDDQGREQLEFQPQHLFGFMVSQFIQDWSSGKTYRFCKNPGCSEYFYFGAGTKHRNTGEYHSNACYMAHRYQLKKEKANAKR